jgi:hypothetical protein
LAKLTASVDDFCDLSAGSESTTPPKQSTAKKNKPNKVSFRLDQLGAEKPAGL